MNYKYIGLHGMSGQCNLQLYGNLAVIEECNNPDITSTITNVVEKVATSIAFENKIPLLDLVWVEHRPEDLLQGRNESYMRVFFKYMDGELVLPRYKHITKENFDSIVSYYKG